MLAEVPARGTATKVSDPQFDILTYGLANAGWIPRGAIASITQLLAMHKRGYVAIERGTWSGRRGQVIGATVTATGYRRLAQLTDERIETAQRAADLAKVLAY
jgi:hypothetical protein